MKGNMMIKKIIFLLFFLIITTGFTAAQDKYKPVSKFDPQRDAAKDISNAVNYAKKNDKRVFVDVGGNWCIWCHRMDDFIKNHEKVKKLLEYNYVEVKINYSKENKNEKVLSNYPKIEGYPHIFILDSNGKLVHSQDTGLLESGKGYSEEKYIEFLEKWAPGKS
jgi:thioredoxin-related protein